MFKDNYLLSKRQIDSTISVNFDEALNKLSVMNLSGSGIIVRILGGSINVLFDSTCDIISDANLDLSTLNQSTTLSSDKSDILFGLITDNQIKIDEYEAQLDIIDAKLLQK